MLKKKVPVKAAKRPKTVRKARVDRERIAATIAELKQIKPANAKSAKMIELMITWLSDESGYDEETWPILKKALNLERKCAGRVEAI